VDGTVFIKTITAYASVLSICISPSLQGQERSQGETQTDAHSNHAINVQVEDGSKQIQVSFGERGLLSWISTAFGLVDSLDGKSLDFLEDDCLDTHIGEDLIIGEDSEINCNILMIDGDLTVNGIVHGGVALINGDLSVEGDGRVSGRIQSIGGRGTHNSAGDIGGLDSSHSHQVGFNITKGFNMGWGGEVIKLVAVFGQVLALLLLGLVGSFLLKLGGSYVEDLSTIVEKKTGRTILVGLLVAVLTPPVFLLGVVALAISIVGIPLILLWILVLPAALSLTWLLGILLASKWLGNKILTHGPGFLQDKLSPGQLYHTVPVGLVGLGAPLMLASLFSMVPGTGVLSVVLVVIGMTLQVLTPLVGMGATFLVIKRRIL
jgi:hypothetical protein